jgi:hypothetical protein
MHHADRVLTAATVAARTPRSSPTTKAGDRTMRHHQQADNKVSNKDVKIENDNKGDAKISQEIDLKASWGGEIDFQQVNTQVVGSVNTGNINVSIDF